MFLASLTSDLSLMRFRLIALIMMMMGHGICTRKTDLKYYSRNGLIRGMTETSREYGCKEKMSPPYKAKHLAILRIDRRKALPHNILGQSCPRRMTLV